MEKVHVRQNERVIIVDKDEKEITAMDCGAFIDFYTDKHQGIVMKTAGQKLAKMIVEFDDEIIKAPPCGLSCNMIFAVNLKKDNFEHNLDNKEFEKILYEALLNCFKNCVDSIVINFSNIKEITKSSNCKKPVNHFFAALKQFYIGQKEGTNHEMYSHRYDGLIYVVCPKGAVDEYKAAKAHEFGQLDDTVAQSQTSGENMNKNSLNSVKRQVGQFCSEITLVEEKVRDVQDKDDFASVQCRLTSIENTLDIVEQLMMNFDGMATK